MSSSSLAATTQLDQLNSDRHDAALIQKWHSRLQNARSEFHNLSNNTPNFKINYLTELVAKLDEGIEYTKLLATLSLGEAKDISRSPESTRPVPVVIVVDTPEDIKSMITYIVACYKNDPYTLDLFIDAEGKQVDGGLTLFQVFLDSRNTVYLVDVLTLKDSAFTAANSDGTSLKDVLESFSIRKAFYDIRGDAHDLWNYGIHVAAVDDLNLYAIACYQGTAKDKGRLLDICLEQNTKRDLSDHEREHWIQHKKWGKAQFNDTKKMIEKIRSGEEDGEGWIPTFNQRPLRGAVVQYAVNDVTVLPIIYRDCMVRLKAQDDGGRMWKIRIVLETDMHIAASQVRDYQVANPDRKHGVRGWKGIE